MPGFGRERLVTFAMSVRRIAREGDPSCAMVSGIVLAIHVQHAATGLRQGEGGGEE